MTQDPQTTPEIVGQTVCLIVAYPSKQKGYVDPFFESNSVKPKKKYSGADICKSVRQDI